MFVVFRAEGPVQSAHFRIYGQRAPGREPSAESTPVYILWAESPGGREPCAESTSALYLFRESESKTQYSFVLRGCVSSILYRDVVVPHEFWTACEALAARAGERCGRRLWSLVSERRSGFDSRYNLLGTSSAAFLTRLHVFGHSESTPTTTSPPCMGWPRSWPRRTSPNRAVLPPTKPLCLHRWPPSIARWLMNGPTAARHGRIGNGLQWAEGQLFFTAVGVRADRSRRSFRSKTCSEHTRPTPLGQDNQSTLTLCNSTHFNARTKYISLRYHHCGDQLRAGVVQLRYLPTESMTADILTKPLPQAAHKTHTAVLLGHQ